MQKCFKSNIEFRNQFIVSAIKFGKTDIDQNGVQIIKTCLEYESKPIIYFRVLRIFTLISKDKK